MTVARYVVVDVPNHLIVGGPYMWDGVSPWDAPVSGTVMPLASALVAGHVFSTNVATNEQTVRDRATQALAANATFLAIASPTAGQIATQVTRLTKEVNALIRLAVSATGDITDTA